MADEIDDDFTEEDEEPEDLVDLDELDEDELDEEDLAEEGDLEDDAVLADEDGVADGGSAATATEEDEEEEEDDEVLDPDDVEASLDVILKDRLVVEDEEEEAEDDEPPDPEERAEGTGRIMPRRPGEFVCQSCFLVKHPSQLEDPKRMFCRDCV